MSEAWVCQYCTYHNAEGSRCELCHIGKDEIIDEQGTSTSERNPPRHIAFLAVVPGKHILNGVLRGVFALVGSFAGAVAGALAANSSRGTLIRGAGLGALAGAIVSIEALETSQLLFESSTSHHVRSSQRLINAISGFQLCFLHWRIFSIDPDIETALRELRLPQHVLIRLSNTSRGSRRDIEEGNQLQRRNRSSEEASGTSQGLTPEELRQVSYKVLPKDETSVSYEREVPLVGEENKTSCAQCAICFEGFAPGEHIRILPSCKHEYHAQCLDPWLKQHSSCPICRKSVLL